MRFSVSYILIIFFIIFSIFASDFEELEFEHLTQKQGLSDDRLFSILKDNKGFMWFGTQNGLNRYDGYNFVEYKYDQTDSNSISGNTIYSILFKDSKEYLWIGTFENGLNKFDRYTKTFTRYSHNPNDEKSIGHNHVFVIYEDKQGILWIGTWGGGLNKFDRKTEKFTRFKQSVDDPNNKIDMIMQIYEDKSGMFWIGTQKGLYLFDRNQKIFTNFDFPETIPTYFNTLSFNSIIEDSNGMMWFGTDRGLFKFDRKRNLVKHYKNESGNSKSLNSNFITTIVENKIDDDHALWITTLRGGGLNKFYIDDESVNRYSNDSKKNHSISTGWHFHVFQDDVQKLLWIGGTHDGVNLLINRETGIQHHIPNPAFDPVNDENYVLSFYKDKTDTLWVGARKGLFQYDPDMNITAHYKHETNNPNSIGYNGPLKIIEDKSGLLWLGTSHEGLNKFNRQSKEFFRLKHDPENDNSISHNYVWEIFEDRFGMLWIGNRRDRGGLNMFDRKKNEIKQFYNDPSNSNSLAHNWITAIHEDRFGSLWIATQGEGISRLKPENREKMEFINYKHITTDNSTLSNNIVFDIFEDSEELGGNLWFGTAEGLNIFNWENETFSSYSRKDGLLSDYIHGFVRDKKGVFWLNTSRGMVRFNPGELPNQKYKLYSLNDEIPLSRLNKRGCYIDRNGKIYFGGEGGFISFYPDSMKYNTHIPPILITDFKVHNNRFQLDSCITTKKSIYLIHKENFFSFEFAALDYVNSEKNKYAYYLEGIDDNWIYCGNTRYANYSSIAPGEYIFHVKGSNNDGIWNEKGTSLKIIITPPWWKTNYAYAFYFLIIFSGLYSWKNYERKKQRLKAQFQIEKEREKAKFKETELRAVAAELQAKAADHQARALAAQTEVEKEQMRSRIASDLHDEIGSNLSSIALISQTLQKKLNSALKEKKHLQNIHHIARMTADSMRDIIWFINPENDDLSRLIIKMRESTNLMLGEINFTFNSNDTEFSFEPDLNFKRNLFLIFKEILQNIIKHSQAKRVDVNISQSEKHFILHVKDDGIGFDTPKNTDGNGLKNIKNRARQIDCNLEIDTVVGKGTSIKLLAKIP